MTREIVVNLSSSGTPITGATVTLSNAGATYGIRRADTLAVIVNAGAAVAHAGGGRYVYAFASAVPGIAYEVTAKVVLPGGSTYYVNRDLAASSTRLVTFAEMQAQARIDDDDEQAYVESLIDAATDYAEEALGATLIARERVIVFRDGEQMRLPWGPVLSITSVIDGRDQAFTDYELRTRGKLEIVQPNSSIGYPVTVTYRAGYENAAAVPSSILQAIRMHVATLYKVRESVLEKALQSVPQTLEDFYRLKSRRIGVA